MAITFAGADDESSEKLTEKEILLKILEKMTSIDKHLVDIFEMQFDDLSRKKVDRGSSDSYFSGL